MSEIETARFLSINHYIVEANKNGNFFDLFGKLESVVPAGDWTYHSRGRRVPMQIDRMRICAVFVSAVLVTALACRPAIAKECASQPHVEPGVMTADAVMARPVGTVTTVVGFALFLVASPFAAMGGNTDEAWESLVAAPAAYTFKRPLGHFECEPSVHKKD
ncbi:hypothetical protein [Desulfobulbus elongatus]|uniref:hypothetical protein n=1 Tax=Desulfobulbus elongatus TaxID=53332 RepID=UPI00068709DE|nr:hypothetical protein [Desulfobulbus elongatus]